MKKMAPFIIIVVFAVFFSLFKDFRYADPDQYFHLTVAHYQAETGQINLLPHVKGLAWDKSFVDKEFLFHQFLQIAYRIGGESAVWAMAFLFSLSVLLSIYLFTLAFTENVSLALLAALTPLLSDTFVLKLMVLRAYVPAVALLFVLLFCLLRAHRWGLFFAAFFFMQFYHAFYIPLSILLLSLFLQKEARAYVLWGFLGLVLGSVISPTFPNNIRLILLPLFIVMEQFQSTNLPFGPEQEPFRSDHLLLVFRFCFAFLVFVMATWCLLWRKSTYVQRGSDFFERQYIFISSLTGLYLFGLLISPRFQEYFIPLMSVLFAGTLVFWKNRRPVYAVSAGAILFITLIARPYQGFSQQIRGFQEFDQTHFNILKGVSPRPLMNCEWWGGHYAMYLSPDFKVLDVLDPLILQSVDFQLWSLASDLRQNKIEDPYQLLKIMNYDLVLCSNKVPLNQRLKEDPRFRILKTEYGAGSELTLYERLPENTIVANRRWRVTEESGETVPVDLQLENISHDFYFVAKPKGCLTLKAENPPAMGADWLVVSGRGEWEGLELSNEPHWGEWMFKAPKDWQQRSWRICPPQQGSLVFALFLLTDEQKKKWCEEPTTAVKSSWKAPNRCAAITTQSVY